uniref:Rhodopsin N-terminal domain-containing protein n=1 Tax=Hucho hucho TaxID=62062 RepID=A0A4W5R1T5_9TELE
MQDGTEGSNFYIPMSNMTGLVRSPFEYLQFYLADPWQFYLLAFYMFFLICFGFPINSLTLHGKVLSMTVICGYLDKTKWKTYYNYCISLFPCVILGQVSLWSLVVLAIEGYIVVCKPMGSFTFSTTHTSAGCAFAWVMAMTCAAPPLPPMAAYVLYLFSCQICVSVIAIVFTYGSLVLTVNAIRPQGKTQIIYPYVTRMRFVMVCGFLIAWTPYTSFAVWIFFNKRAAFTAMAAHILVVRSVGTQWVMGASSVSTSKTGLSSLGQVFCCLLGL